MMENEKKKLSRTSRGRRSSRSCVLPIVLVLCTLVAHSEAGWVDPDTPEKRRKTKSLTQGDDRQYELVFSDEFEEEGRRLDNGLDPRWTSIDKNDYTNAALHFYSQENAYTANGVLNITTEQKVNTYKAFDEKKKIFYADKKYVQSAMVQSWNKFCFTGGVVEFSAKLPGSPKIGGLWPALWMMGNLARATYVGSSDYMWPFSYNKCDTRTRKSQEISSCSRVNHFGLDPFQGRGAPEIDLIEAMQGDPGKLPNTFIQRPYQSASLQVAPGVEIDRPALGHRPHTGHWYEDLDYGNSTPVDLNPFFYGVTLIHKPKAYTYQADAISANMQLNDTHYETQHLYRVEWEPPAEDGTGGYIRWYTDNKFVYGIHGESLAIMGTEIPSEPMYLLMNTAVSSTWGFPAPCPENCDCECFECGNPLCTCALPSNYCENFPAGFEIDYVRVYQAVNESKHILGCSPEKRPTAQFIEGHAKRYMSEGDRRPLEPIAHGGGSCLKDSDCGSQGGKCSSGVCSCPKDLTGPHCRAHNGFYDYDTSKPIPPFFLSALMVPKGLMIVIALLVIGFLMSIIGTVRVKSKEGKYTQMTAAGASPSAYSGNGLPGSYQNPSVSNYAMPPQQKVNTYCVIDSRLVDS